MNLFNGILLFCSLTMICTLEHINTKINIINNVNVDDSNVKVSINNIVNGSSFVYSKQKNFISTLLRYGETVSVNNYEDLTNLDSAIKEIIVTSLSLDFSKYVFSDMPSKDEITFKSVFSNLKENLNLEVISLPQKLISNFIDSITLINVKGIKLRKFDSFDTSLIKNFFQFSNLEKIVFEEIKLDFSNLIDSLNLYYLKVLKIVKCELEDKNYPSLVNVIRNSPELEVLDISLNNFSHKNLLELLDVAQISRSLLKISISIENKQDEKLLKKIKDFELSKEERKIYIN